MSGEFKSFGQMMGNPVSGGAVRSFKDFIEKTDLGKKIAAQTSQEEPLKEERVEPIIEEIESALDEALKQEPPIPPVVEEKTPPTKVEESASTKKAYRVLRDKTENFECNVSVEGASVNDSKARIILESESGLNLVYYGKIDSNGKCTVPIKKGLPLNEGSTGKIRLEIIVDDQLFEGWEDSFIVETSKKVKVDVSESRSVKVSFGRVDE